MAAEICQQCGKRMTEEPAAYKTVDLPGVARHCDRFYEQWFVCSNGHRKGYISGHSYVPALARVVSKTDVVSLRAS